MYLVINGVSRVFSGFSVQKIDFMQMYFIAGLIAFSTRNLSWTPKAVQPIGVMSES